MKEKDIENQILQYLHFLPDCEAWKVDTTGIFDAKRGVFRKRNFPFSHAKGVPDIIGFWRGFFFAFEVKTPQRKNSASEDQKFFINTAKANGQIAHVVWSLEQVKEILDADYIRRKCH